MSQYHNGFQYSNYHKTTTNLSCHNILPKVKLFTDVMNLDCP